MSYSTLPGQLGPILYSSVILQTILCLVLFLLFVPLFSPHTPVELDSFFCLLSCTPLDLLLHLASSMCAAASFELMYPDTAWWACSSVLFSFFLFLEQSTEFINWNTVSTHFSPLGQSPTVPASSSEAPPPPHIPSYRQVWLGFKYYSADFPQPLWGQVHCVDYLYNSRE